MLKVLLNKLMLFESKQ